MTSLLSARPSSMASASRGTSVYAGIVPLACDRQTAPLSGQKRQPTALNRDRHWLYLSLRLIVYSIPFLKNRIGRVSIVASSGRSASRTDDTSVSWGGTAGCA